MQSGNPARRSQTLCVLAILFISAYFFLFSYGSLNTYFTFDDGMNLVHLHRQWEVPVRASIVDALKVFTASYRPLGALVYRPLYNLFGFNPLPFRIVAYLLMILNIVLAYRFSRALGAAPEASALSTLLFCYNGSMFDLYYNTGTIYDLMCFPLYIVAVLIYTRRRSNGAPLTLAGMASVLLLFLAALDAKEMAVTLPAALLAYEVIYRYRDFKSTPNLLRTGGFLTLMFALSAVFLRVKVAEMGSNPNYHPNLSVSFILTAMGHYFEQLFYLQAESFGPGKVALALTALLASSLALRSCAIAYGTLFFAIGLLPLSVISPRSGYAAYVAYPGLTLSIGVILASARSALLRRTRKDHLELASCIALFLCVAAVSVKSFAHTRKIFMSNALWDEQRRIDLLTGLKRQIPEFPPNARILVLDDPWGADWGPMFLTQLLYHDPSVWMDRVKNSAQTGDPDSYDLLITYKQPLMGTTPSRLFGIRKDWEVHWIPLREGQLTITAPSESRAIRNIEFLPAAARAGRAVTLRIPGLSNVKIDAIFRTVSNNQAATHMVDGWCTLDSAGACTVPAPHGGQIALLTVDWVRPSKGRWIFTNGVLTVVE